MDYNKMREAAMAILALLIPSHVSVLQYVIDNCTDEILATEETAEAFLNDALKRRSVSAESIALAVAFLAPYLKAAELVPTGIVSEESWNAMSEAAMIPEIQAAIVEAQKAIPAVTTNGKREDFRRTFAKAMGIHVQPIGKISGNLTILYNRHVKNGSATNLDVLDREAIRAEALALNLPIITLA